jgi:uncharacterized protein
MQTNSTAQADVIEQTKKWINDVVVACNFCPFAARVMKKQTVHYEVSAEQGRQQAVDALIIEAVRLDDNDGIDTSFLIFSTHFEIFADYLDLVHLAEAALIKNGYEGIYQLASFHPLYQFADSLHDDAANYTNRSSYPMLHLLREASIDEALLHYTNAHQIPQRNIDFARNKGLTYMKMLRDNCLAL